MVTAPAKGFRDIEDASKRIAIRNIIEEIFRKYNYIPVETPVIEAEEFVRGENASDEAVSETFKLKDRGERALALRYEFTFQLKRLAMNKKLPYKRYEMGYVFRDEPTAGNRWKQFTQCDVDVVGSSVKEEAEVLKIASEIFGELGIKITTNVNNRKLLNEILEKAGVNEENKSAVIKEIDKLDKLSEGEVKANLKKYKAEKVLDIFKKGEKEFEKYENYKEIKSLKEECRALGISVVFVPFLARGLSYYNGSIYEIKKTRGFLDDPKSKGFMDIKTKEMKETIAGGGSYLVNGIQATGISLGLDRLELLAEIKDESKKVLIISLDQDKKALSLASDLRKNNVACTIMYGKVSKALDYANSYGLPYTIFIGEEEVKKGKLKIRDMRTGKEEMLSEKGILEKFEK